METPVLNPGPVSLANELISLGHRAIDEGRDSAPYFDHAERILNAYEATGRGDVMCAGISRAIAEAVAWISA